MANRDNSGGGSADEQEDEDDGVHFYDRSKSFFDNISCESLERAKGSVIMLAVVSLVVVSIVVNPLNSKGNYSATSNNTKLVHWLLMDGLLHLVQRCRGGAWVGWGSA